MRHKFCMNRLEHAPVCIEIGLRQKYAWEKVEWWAISSPQRNIIMAYAHKEHISLIIQEIQLGPPCDLRCKPQDFHLAYKPHNRQKTSQM